MLRGQVLFGLTALWSGFATIACAEVRLEGTPEAVRVTTSKDKISDVLSAFSARFNLKYQASVPLDADAKRAYAGTLHQVISSLLDGYNYIVKVDNNSTEIIILGERGQIILPARARPEQNILWRWR